MTLRPMPGDGWTDLRFVYAGQPSLPPSGINQISADWVELSIDSAWHPVVAAIDRALTADIEVVLPGDWDVVTSGDTRRIEGGFRLTTTLHHADIAFTAAPGLDVAEAPGFQVYHRGADAETTTAVLATAATCRDELDRRFGANDELPPGRLVLTARNESGYARKNYIVLTDVAGYDDVRLMDFLCHELAHFWSSGAKPLTVDNWLNEGFAVLVAAEVVRATHGDATWQRNLDTWRQRAAGQPSIWTADDLDRRPFAVSYHKAPLALSRLAAKIGPEVFDRWVVRYMTDPIDSTPALLDALEAEAGTEARRWFESVLAESDA